MTNRRSIRCARAIILGLRSMSETDPNLSD
jgi:hypothetical protein